jgi:hypothetical protein
LTKSSIPPLHTEDSFLSDIIEIEAYYDECDRAHFELKKEMANSRTAALWNLYSLLWDKKYTELFQECDKLFFEFKDPTVNAFVIQAAIAACEILFDLELRIKWLRLWNQMESFSNSPYAQYLYYYHKGNSYYFGGNRPESIKCWNKGIALCKAINYKRGIFRLKYFSGKAYEDLEFLGQAKVNYESALILAKSVNAIRFIERIQFKLNTLSSEKHYLFDQKQVEIFNLINSGNIKKAKKLTLFYCRCRRFEKRSWGSESEWILLALIAAAEKKINRFYRLLNFMDSENIKWIVLNVAEILWSDIKTLDKRFEHNLNLLKMDSFKTKSESRSLLNENSLDNETEQLINLLKSNQNGISKEMICTNLWCYNYDPTIHDSRIYVAISKVRKFYGSKQSVTNAYGDLYKINSLLIEGAD